MAKRKKRTSRSFPVKVFVILIFFFGVVGLGFNLFLNFKKPVSNCANSISCISDLSGKIDTNSKTGIFMGKEVAIPSEIAVETESQAVLGENTGDKHIYIDLTNQKLYAMENGQKVFEFLISSGKWGRTPTGEFTTWIKLRATRMTGGNKSIGTFYDLPNVPYTMYFSNSEIPKSRGYGIHGAYWHNNFGHPMSHGCINMAIADSKTLYEWANPPSIAYTTYVDKDHPGTPITIYGDAPWQ